MKRIIRKSVAASSISSKRHFLRQIELETQRIWQNKKVYELDIDESKPKYLVTFPYPYMNGRLHLGHAYSLSKCEFTARFQRHLGKNALFPFAFHCTGMPIAACADHLKRELDPSYPIEKRQQYNTMLTMEVPEEEIPNFTDPLHWCRYFPPKAQHDLLDFGAAIDWRRAFVSTEINPYHDSFVRWHFIKLRQANKIYYTKRHTIYSILDGQPCADHDRKIGEGVVPKEYTLIKIQIKPPFKEAMASLEGKQVFLVAATLRPETMYGQTNCYVLPTGTYGAFEMPGDEVFVCSERSMRNMAFQDMTHEAGKYRKIMDINGMDLLGLPLSAPLAQYETVYSLPMESISMAKGTGVVTSVPSDSPDDYAMLRDLQSKSYYLEKYNLTPEMVNFQVVPIIEIPELGNTAAVRVVEELKIKSHRDAKLLKEAKDKVYLKGFNEGIMIIGSQAGRPVQEAKQIVRQEMIDQNLAAAYWEPEQTVISRSQDECVVALCDQWILNYGEEQWKEDVKNHVQNSFKGYNPTVESLFSETLEWFHEWACSRSYGLGTKLPWDESQLIESLSDSTIYMAYYTVSHFLQGGNIEGAEIGPLGIKAEDMNEQAWDYVFLLSDQPPSHIDLEKINMLRSEFEYWYPMDLRCSGKDLIKNHLTMSLYNHAAIWKVRPDLWPKSFFCNGHVNVDGQKMSKSLGNFLTLKYCVEKYGADSTRLALAESGDTIDDANFTHEAANSAILKLFTLHKWVDETLQALDTMRTDNYNFFDRLFENELNYVIEKTRNAYESMLFRDVAKFCFFDLHAIREEYARLSNHMHRDLVIRYIEVQLILLSPITPHICEQIWKMLDEKLQQNRGLVVDQLYPSGEYDPALEMQIQYIRNTIKNGRNIQDRARGKNKQGPLPNKAVIYYSEQFGQMEMNILTILQEKMNQNPQAEHKDYIQHVKSHPNVTSLSKQELQKSMQYASFVLGDFKERGTRAFESSLPFDEEQTLNYIRSFIENELGLVDLKILRNIEVFEADRTNARQSAQPGRPSFYFYI